MSARVVYMLLELLALSYKLLIMVLSEQQRKKPLPEEVADIYEPERYRKYLNYVSDNRKMVLLSTAVTLAIWTASIVLSSVTIVLGPVVFYGFFLVPYIVAENPDIGTFDLLPQVALPSRMIRVSSLCQGIAFVGNEAFISQSIGILGSSLRRYTQELEEEDFDARNRNASARIRLPAMLEQIATDDQGRLYMIFESAASAYRYWPKETVDRVVVCNNFVQAEAIAAEEGV